jgi:hypothetical protein
MENECSWMNFIHDVVGNDVGFMTSKFIHSKWKMDVCG